MDENEVVEEPKNEINATELLETVERLKSTNDRLLNESKDYASKYRSLRDDIESKEKQALEKSENHRALYEKENIKARELQSSLETMQKKVKEKEYLYQIAKYAPDARDVLLVAQKLPKDQVTWNESTMGFDGIEEGLKDVRKNCDYLFEQKKPVPMTNNFPTMNKPEAKTLSAMNSKEKKDALSGALSTLLNKGL